MTNKAKSFSTLCAHFGLTTEKDGNRPAVSPIAQTSLFQLGTSADAEKIFSGQQHGYMYTRFGNPTVDELGKAVAALEGGASALVTASGNAATLAAVMMSLRGTEDLVVAPNDAYGGTTEVLRLLRDTFGLNVRFVDVTDANEWRAAIALATVVFIESPTNPIMRLIDIAATVEDARKSDTRVIVDNTVATPFNQLPLSLGADLVVHSMSKFLNGHSDMVAGCVVSREDFTPKQRAIHKNLGGTVNALDAWLLLRGLRTFSLRMDVHNRNGLQIAEWLKSHPKVERVNYPGLPEHPQAAIFRKQMKGGSAVMSFELKGGRTEAEKIIDRLQLIVHGVSLGGMESLVTRPAGSSHRGMTEVMRAEAGVTEGLIRMSVGVESADDIIADLEQALR